jgi:hypothetical protein
MEELELMLVVAREAWEGVGRAGARLDDGGEGEGRGSGIVLLKDP